MHYSYTIKGKILLSCTLLMFSLNPIPTRQRFFLSPWMWQSLVRTGLIKETNEICPLFSKVSFPITFKKQTQTYWMKFTSIEIESWWVLILEFLERLDNSNEFPHIIASYFKWEWHNCLITKPKCNKRLYCWLVFVFKKKDIKNINRAGCTL